MGQATAPRVQALISTSDNEWIKKHKPKDETTSKFVASLIAEAIEERKRLIKIGSGTNDAVHNAALECAAKLEELNNMCKFFGRKLKDDIRHHLDGTQFEDGLLYEAFITNSSAPALPPEVQTQGSKDIPEAAKAEGHSVQTVSKKAAPLPSEDAQMLKLKLMQELMDQLKSL